MTPAVRRFARPFVAPLARTLERQLQPLEHPAAREAGATGAYRVLAGGAMMTAIVLALGGGHLAIGLVAAFPYAARIVQLWVPRWAMRYGASKLVIRAGAVERAGSVLVALSALLQPANALLWALVGYALAMLGLATYDAANTTFQCEVIPQSVRGRFSGVRTRWNGLFGFAAGVVGGFGIDALEGGGVVPVVARGVGFALGVVVSVAAVVSFRAFREHTRHIWSRLPTGDPVTAATLRGLDAHERRVVTFAGLWGLGFAITMRHTDAFGITVLGLSVGSMTLLAGLLTGGAVLGAMTWGVLADRFGGRPVLMVAAFVMAIDPVWLLLSAIAHPFFFVASYATFGIASAGMSIGLAPALVLSSGPINERIRRYTLFQAAFGLAAGVAPLLGGVFLEFLAPLIGARRAYLGLFVTAVVLRLIAWRHMRHLPTLPATAMHDVLRVLGRLNWWRVSAFWRGSEPPRGRPAPPPTFAEMGTAGSSLSTPSGLPRPMGRDI